MREEEALHAAIFESFLFATTGRRDGSNRTLRQINLCRGGDTSAAAATAVEGVPGRGADSEQDRQPGRKDTGDLRKTQWRLSIKPLAKREAGTTNTGAREDQEGKGDRSIQGGKGFRGGG
eukprot:TRINITY_DN7256_c0_g1_i3.p1 TRINITY_DN7256_c0_g1~~TRINITY_DN7256_c0_g1_i3.p1  ORF type:complete len:120 (+),score=24.54 TRINITY_DN7256_c0_g1_i3:226-585(+)